jgi:uncharacterized protein with HEPN domain
MKVVRAPLNLDRMREAANLELSYIDGIAERDFLSDSRTQQAVAMNRVFIGEAFSRIIEDDPEFVTRRAELPWRQRTGMRNRIAHGYFDLNMRVLWVTALTFVWQLLNRIPKIRAAESGDAGNPTQT